MTILAVALLALITGQHPLNEYPPRPRPNDPVRNPAVPARLIKLVRPHYSPQALRQRIEGIVIVELTVERDGRVSHGRVLKPLPSGLTQKAIDAVRHWRYKPARDGRGRRVRSIVSASVRFDLSRP